MMLRSRVLYWRDSGNLPEFCYSQPCSLSVCLCSLLPQRQPELITSECTP